MVIEWSLNVSFCHLHLLSTLSWHEKHHFTGCARVTNGEKKRLKALKFFAEAGPDLPQTRPPGQNHRSGQ